MADQKLVVLGLSITSSYGNGHATTYRGLLKALHARGWQILFLERDLPLYRDRRDLEAPDFCAVEFYDAADELDRHAKTVREADAVIIGSYVRDGPEVIDRVRNMLRGTDVPLLFYDIDTPVTVALLDEGPQGCPYLKREQIPHFDGYLSFTGGPILEHIRSRYGARRAWPLYCNVDPTLHAGRDEEEPPRYALGYLGTYSEDRQPSLDRLLMDPARVLVDVDFIVAGPLYPDAIYWPQNVQRIDHVPPDEHADFYANQRFTLNLTRAAMRRWGHAPSVRLFEAAACGTPILTDRWQGIETFFAPDEEIIIVDETGDVLEALEMPDEDRRQVGRKARERVLRDHTGEARAKTLEDYLQQVERQRVVHQGAT